MSAGFANPNPVANAIDKTILFIGIKNYELKSGQNYGVKTVCKGHFSAMFGRLSALLYSRRNLVQTSDKWLNFR
jgi:hypothetical protein